MPAKKFDRYAMVKKAITIVNGTTGRTKHFKSVTECAAFFKVTQGAISKWRKRNDQSKQYRGWYMWHENEKPVGVDAIVNSPKSQVKKEVEAVATLAPKSKKFHRTYFLDMQGGVFESIKIQKGILLITFSSK